MDVTEHENGIAFLEFDGSIKKYTLGTGQQMIVDMGYLAAMSETCTMDIQKVPGVKNMLFGGESIFNTVLTGPGDIYLQTMPIPQVVGAMIPFLPKSNNG